MDVSDWLREATKQLKDIGIDSPRLDAELILAETLRKPRTYLHAHLDEVIDPRRIDIADARLGLRLDRVPIAYILGYKEFYGREFQVTPSVLVPRPESEDMISLFLDLSAGDIDQTKTLIDIGTGSGCLGITAKLERPNISVTLTDSSQEALEVARQNADLLKASVKIRKQNLLIGQVEPLDYILANLPYVDEAWEVSKELKHEPKQALFAAENGLALIFKLIEQSPRHLRHGGWLLLEADPVQHQRILKHAQKYNLKWSHSQHYCLVLQSVAA